MIRRTGLTLIELAGAIAISGLLLAGALAAVSRLARSEKLLAGRETGQSEAQLLRNVMEADVLHAERYQAAGGGVALRTRCWLDPSTMELEHIQSTVVYGVRKLAGQSWLVRTQQTGIRKPAAELVLAGVRSVELQEEGLRGKPSPMPAQWAEVPDRAIITVRLEGRGDPACAFAIRKR